MFSIITLLLLAQSPDARAREVLERVAPKPAIKVAPTCCCGTNCTCIDCPAKRQAAPAPLPPPVEPQAPPAVEAPKIVPPPAGTPLNATATFKAVNGKWVQTWSRDGKQHPLPSTAVPGGTARSVQAGNPATDPFHPANENPNWDCSSGKCVRRR